MAWHAVAGEHAGGVGHDRRVAVGQQGHLLVWHPVHSEDECLWTVRVLWWWAAWHACTAVIQGPQCCLSAASWDEWGTETMNNARPAAPDWAACSEEVWGRASAVAGASCR